MQTWLFPFRSASFIKEQRMSVSEVYFSSLNSTFIGTNSIFTTEWIWDCGGRNFCRSPRLLNSFTRYWAVYRMALWTLQFQTRTAWSHWWWVNLKYTGVLYHSNQRFLGGGAYKQIHHCWMTICNAPWTKCSWYTCRLVCIIWKHHAQKLSILTQLHSQCWSYNIILNVHVFLSSIYVCKCTCTCTCMRAYILQIYLHIRVELFFGDWHYRISIPTTHYVQEHHTVLQLSVEVDTSRMWCRKGISQHDQVLLVPVKYSSSLLSYFMQIHVPTPRLVALAMSIRLTSSWTPNILWDLVFSRVLKKWFATEQAVVVHYLLRTVQCRQDCSVAATSQELES